VSTSEQAQGEEWRYLSPEEVAVIEARKQAAMRAAQATPGTRTQHLRLAIDFHITIAGTPPDDDGMSEPDPVYHAQQARLLVAVKHNPAVLKQWMCRLIADQMAQKGSSFWDTLAGGEVALQDMLAPALATLAPDDQAYFAEIAAGDYFDDLIALFLASFTIREDTPVIIEQGAQA
jgi:hypothetical protein